jgi:hypothetical protein
VPCIDQLAIDGEALLEADLALLFQHRDRVAAFGKTPVQFGAMFRELLVLGAHARQ